MIKFVQKLKNKKGFTLVELIVVIAIIAILTAVLIPVIGNYTAQAAQTAADQGAAEVKSSLSAVLADGVTGGDLYDTGTITVTNAGGNGVSVSGNPALPADIQAAADFAMTTFPADVTATCTVVNNTITAVTYQNGNITGNA